jgi:DNA topoisomerase-1
MSTNGVSEATQEMVEEAQLRYANIQKPGITRVKKGKDFKFLNTDGKMVREERILNRINSLRIPPAWKDVWICPSPSGHIQAVGTDDRGRRQYIYHPKWIETAQQHKFDNMVYFGDMLPSLRRQIKADLELRGLVKRRILAAVVHIMDKTFIRVGNDTYAKENKHFGLTTLRSKHVKVKKDEIFFNFIAKSGKQHQASMQDPRIASIIKKLEDLPGWEIFQYLDDDRVSHDVNSTDVNDYLKEIGGDNISAKDFRTWGGSVLSAVTLNKLGSFESETQAKKNLVTAVKTVAKNLNNTVAVCRKYYVHPVVPDTYLRNKLIPHFEMIRGDLDKPRGLGVNEYAFYTLVKHRPVKRSSV